MASETRTKYPEHEKLSAVSKESQAQGEFLEWLRNEKKIHFYVWVPRDDLLFDDGQMVPALGLRTEELLAEFHEINLEVIEDEKLAMLEEMRAMCEGGSRG